MFRSFVKLGVNFYTPILSEEMENIHQRDTNQQPYELDAAALLLHYLEFIPTKHLPQPISTPLPAQQRRGEEASRAFNFSSLLWKYLLY